MKLKLTEEEQQLILDNRHKQHLEQIRKEKEQSFSKKTGVLKHDLYFIAYKGDLFELLDNKWKYFTKDELQKFIDDISNSIFDSIVAKKGTLLESYYDGEELWRSVETGSEMGDIEDMNNQWAKENLENIKSIKPQNKKKKS